MISKNPQRPAMNKKLYNSAPVRAIAIQHGAHGTGVFRRPHQIINLASPSARRMIWIAVPAQRAVTRRNSPILKRQFIKGRRLQPRRQGNNNLWQHLRHQNSLKKLPCQVIKFASFVYHPSPVCLLVNSRI
jgi:hypothetical protein